MNLFHQKLYDDLMRLCQNNEAFFFTDQIIASITYRIFNYRLASYTDWLEPHALECRGITFIVEGEGYTAIPKFLASWPFEKFFNLHEVTTDINTLAESLIARGELSREVYERAKRKNPK